MTPAQPSAEIADDCSKELIWCPGAQPYSLNLNGFQTCYRQSLPNWRYLLKWESSHIRREPERIEAHQNGPGSISDATTDHDSRATSRNCRQGQPGTPRPTRQHPLGLSPVAPRSPHWNKKMGSVRRSRPGHHRPGSICPASLREFSNCSGFAGRCPRLAHPHPRKDPKPRCATGDLRTSLV